MKHNTGVWGKGLVGEKKMQKRKKKKYGLLSLYSLLLIIISAEAQSCLFVLEITPGSCIRKYIKYSKNDSFSSLCSRESGVKFSAAVIPIGVILIHYWNGLDPGLTQAGVAVLKSVEMCWFFSRWKPGPWNAVILTEPSAPGQIILSI